MPHNTEKKSEMADSKYKHTAPNHKEKANDVLDSFVKNTSCNRGWLKFFVQAIFAALTVTSFIMIMVSVIRNSRSTSSSPQRLCVTSNCRVICSNVIIEESDDIIYSAVNATEPGCNRTGISLFFHRPVFADETFPLNWLSDIQAHIVELVITSGNLEYIRPDSFMTGFAQTLQILTLEDLNLRILEENMLVGLASLVEFNIRDCRIMSIHRNALRATDETIKILQVKASGSFDPVNLTGSSELQSLTDVDLTLNNFSGILNRDSFKELLFCRVLNLGSSGITHIRPGTFDNLIRIEKIYLNNNCLKTIDSGLFNRLITLSTENMPKIDLQHNFWNCDCYLESLKELQNNDFLVGDPVCHGPPKFRGRPFSRISTFCTDGSDTSLNTNYVSEIEPDQCIQVEELNHDARSSIYLEGVCNNTEANKLIPYKCPRQNYEYIDMQELMSIRNAMRFQSSVLSSVFFINSQSTSIMEIKTSMLPGHDLIWFSSESLENIYCVNALPKYLRLYNINENTIYMFCPIKKETRTIVANYCISYVPAEFVITEDDETFGTFGTRFYIRFVFYVLLSILSLITGASLVYVTVLKYPTLLKANKRVLVVKHKNVEALVLPRKVPLRSKDSKASQDFSETSNSNVEKNKIPNFMRGTSTRSTSSNAPSYVSATQPTQAQLAEWRLRYHFDKCSPNPTDLDSEVNPISWIYSNDPIYHSITVPEDLGRSVINDGINIEKAQ